MFVQFALLLTNVCVAWIALLLECRDLSVTMKHLLYWVRFFFSSPKYHFDVLVVFLEILYFTQYFCIQLCVLQSWLQQIKVTKWSVVDLLISTLKHGILFVCNNYLVKYFKYWYAWVKVEIISLYRVEITNLIIYIKI